jgi:hypothetical protein
MNLIIHFYQISMNQEIIILVLIILEIVNLTHGLVNFSEPKSKYLNAYDYNKHFTSCLMGKGSSLGCQWVACIFCI